MASETSSEWSKLRLALAILVIWIAGYLSYSNSFTIAFQFDDTHTVQSNMFVRSLEYIPRYFVDPNTSSYRPENSGYRPMTTTVLAFGFALSGNDTWGYHLIKLIEHCLIATLIVFIGLRMLPRSGQAAPYRMWMAWASGLIFVTHRVHTEVVDYICAVSTLQAGLFFFLAFYLYLRWRDSRKLAPILASMTCYMCSMWSKEEGITLPAIILLYEWYYMREEGESFRQRFVANYKGWLKLLIPYGLLAIAYASLRMGLMDAVAHSSTGSTPRFVYFITQLRSWLHYWALYFWPVNLNADNLSFPLSEGLDDLRVWGALAVHSLIWVAAWKVGKKRRFVFFAVAWMYITVLPASSFFPLVEAVNEHRAYIPYMFMSLLLVWILFEVAAKVSQGRNIALGVIAVCSIALGIGTYERNKVWQTDVSLWEDIYSKNPSSPRAMNVLGVALINKGEHDRSGKLLEECNRIAPAYLPCRVHLSMSYAYTKDYQRGLKTLLEGYQIDPNYPHINYHLGLYYKDYLGDFDSAKRHFENVVRLTAGRFFHATLKLAEISYEEGRVNEGMTTVNSVLQIDRTNGDAWETMAKGYMLVGQWDYARQILERLVAATPDSLRYLIIMANYFERRGDMASARVHFQQATVVNANAIQPWIGLARIAKKLGEPETAKQIGIRIEELKRTNSWVYLPAMFLLEEKPRQTRPE